MPLTAHKCVRTFVLYTDPEEGQMRNPDLQCTHYQRRPMEQLMLLHELAFEPEVPRPIPDIKVTVTHGHEGPYVSVTAGGGEDLSFSVADLDVYLDALQDARRMCVPAATVRVLPSGARVPLRRDAA